MARKTGDEFDRFMNAMGVVAIFVIIGLIVLAVMFVTAL